MLTTIKDRLPDFARDARLNLGILDSPGELAPAVAWGTALATAAAARNPELLTAIRISGAAHLDDAHTKAALAAASVMAMNNVYYRFRHFMGDDTPYATMPARLRMQAIGNPGVDAKTFELWCLAVSAVNGCETCVRSHEQAVRTKGGTTGEVHDAIRIAAVIQSVAVSLEAALPP